MTESDVRPASGPLDTTPEAILAAADLSGDEKRKRLEDLKLDIVERQTATAENMPVRGDAGHDLSDLLRRVNEALESLD